MEDQEAEVRHGQVPERHRHDRVQIHVALPNMREAGHGYSGVAKRSRLFALPMSRRMSEKLLHRKVRFYYAPHSAWVFVLANEMLVAHIAAHAGIRAHRRRVPQAGDLSPLC